MQTNPFHKPNPYHINKYNKFKHAHLTEQYSYLSITEATRPSYTRIPENNWIFHQNNLSKRVDFNRKVDTSLSQVSEFELKVKMSAAGIPQSVNSKPPNLETKLQNPFYRKNLLVNQQQAKNLVQMDVSLYRNRVKSSYDVSQPDTGSRRSYIKMINSNVGHGLGAAASKNSPNESEDVNVPLNIKDLGSNQKETRFLRPEQMTVSQYVGDSPMGNNTLSYSKTPQITTRVSEKQGGYADLDPKFISYKNKKYYLNNVNLIFA